MRLLPAQALFGLRGRVDDRGRAAALHRDGRRPAVHRHPRRVHRRLRLRARARLQGNAEAERALRRFTRGGPKHPTYQAIEEPGRAVRTAFVGDCLADVEPSQGIHEGPQVVEDRDSANKDLFHGKDGDLAGADKGSQEVSMLALHLLQSALVHVDTLLMQQVLADPKWAEALTDADRRALSPPFRTHVNPYGRFEPDMNSRLEPDPAAQSATVPGPRTAPGSKAPRPTPHGTARSAS
ncbi:Tn3 family transposase [Streptomyces sp. Act-28]